MSQGKIAVKSAKLSNAEYAKEITTQWFVLKERTQSFLEIGVKVVRPVVTGEIPAIGNEVTLQMQFQVKRQLTP